jgi:hypothetical protein
VVKSRGQHCGDIELVGYLGNESDPVPLVVDLRIAHDRVGSSTDPTLNGHLRYPNNLDQSLNDTVADKIRKYRTDYNNRPPSAVSFMTAIASTSGGYIANLSDFNYRRAAFSDQLKSDQSTPAPLGMRPRPTECDHHQGNMDERRTGFIATRSV